MNTHPNRARPPAMVCPECGEPAQPYPPRVWPAGNGPAPAYSHVDGEPLCPVIGPDGYRPAQPRIPAPPTIGGSW